MLYELSQNFNNGSAKGYMKIDTDELTLTGLIALMPLGMSVFAPTATGAVGAMTAVPIVFTQALISCLDSLDRMYSISYVGLKYGKATLSDDDMVLACKGNVDVPNGTPCNQVNVSKYKRVGV